MTALGTAVELASVTKRYDATVALNDVSVDFARGQVQALLGENGAGKSTLVKLLSGLVEADSGRLLLNDQEVRLRSPREAHAKGIQTAFQELLLIEALTVTQNMMLPYEPVSGAGLLRKQDAERFVAAQLDRLEIHGIDPRAEIGELDLPQRQKIGIARAVSRQPSILLLDEPTSSLSGADVDWLGGLIDRLSGEGVTILFVSHRMAEVRRFCSRLSVLRNGRHVGTFETAEISDEEVIRLVIGRSLAATFPPKPAPAEPKAAAPVMSGRGIAAGKRLEDATFALYPGEVLGIAGLEGMGQRDLFMALFGVTPLTSGELELDGAPVSIASPVDAVRQGISLVPEDRKTEGLMLGRSGRENVSLPVIDRLATLGWIDTGREALEVDRVLARMQVHPRALYTPAAAFSGGNQQKISIAKWLMAQARIFLMFDPTRGVDVGTKHEIYVLVREFAEAGGAVLFYSTEVPEIVNLCDRVLVMYRGRIVAELAGDAVAEETIMRAALGGHDPAVEDRLEGSAAE
jgi:ribose transport system ATP-binding protein